MDADGNLNPESIQDKVDEELEEMEMEADGSEVSETRTGSRADPYSLRTTPNSIISITDEETVEDTLSIDLTTTENQDDTIMVIESRLREDAYKVLRILGEEKGPRLLNFDEIYAYLEAHLWKPNRVQIVVEEFLGMNDIGSHSRTPSPEIFHSEQGKEEDEPRQFSGKGKGVGKNSNKFRPVSPPVDSDASTSKVISIASPRAVKRKDSHEEEDSAKKVKLEGSVEPVDANKTSDPIVSKAKVGTIKDDPITPDMLYGPFDFTQHRSESKFNRRTKNLPDALHQIVENASNKKRERKQEKFCLTPSRLKLGETASPEFKEQEKEDDSSSGSSGFLPLNRQPLIHPAKISLGDTSTKQQPPDVERMGRERTPSIEVMQEIVVENNAEEVVEIPDNDPTDAAEVKALSENLVSMFPDTPHLYIQQRCVDLVGKPAAIERFTEELLIDPQPPKNWEQIYKKPFIVVESAPSPPVVVPDDVPAEPESILEKEPTAQVGDACTSAAPVEGVGAADPPLEVAGPSAAPVHDVGTSSAFVNDGGSSTALIGAAIIPVENVATAEVDHNPAEGASTSEASGSKETEEIDPVVQWQVERHQMLESMFPNICPDYLMDQVEAASSVQRAEDVEVKLSIADMDQVFAAKVEQMFAMGPEQKSALPTRDQWLEKKKQAEELEKWSTNIKVEDMLLLYDDDPAGYFGNSDRKPESELYKQHAIEGLKDKFRYDSIMVIDRVFKKSRFLYYPSFKQLKNNTRKTKRPDAEVKYPSKMCIEFLKEKKYTELEQEIDAEKKRRVTERAQKLENAALLGTLQECLCCYSADCLPEDMISCKGGHLYCKECISRGASVAIGDGKTVIECLGHCTEEIGWQELQKVLTPNVLSKLLQRRQAEEVGAAELENLVTCPFCPYITIMDNPDDRVLVCRNPECGRDSCRLCQEPNHVPLRCDEIEKKGQEAERKRIEEQLSEAMMRTCYKCNVKYFKEEGCNKMKCPRPNCGASMCYLCKQPVKDYTHFYGQGGAPGGGRTCPLWTDNKKLHEQEVAKAAAKAKVELQEKNIQLKYDPTAGHAAPADGVENNVAPDVADVIAPGVPRDVLIRQQRQIEDMIRHGGRIPAAGPAIYPHLYGPGGPIQIHGPGGHRHGPWRDGLMEQMHEIMRMREQQRANMRLIRQREQQALRDIERANRVVAAAAAPVVPAPAPAAAPLPPAPFPVYGNPQAVPEPLPFLDLVENHGRNIHIVQQQRMPFIAGPIQVQPFPQQPHRPIPPPAVRPPMVPHQPPPEAWDERRPPPRAAQYEERGAGPQPQGPHYEVRVAHERRQVPHPHRPHYDARREDPRHRQRHFTEMQRDRERRNREEAVMRLRRNREEVLRRQRRHREDRSVEDDARHRRDRAAQLARANSGPRVETVRAGAQEVRVERVANTFRGLQHQAAPNIEPQHQGQEQPQRNPNLNVIL